MRHAKARPRVTLRIGDFHRLEQRLRAAEPEALVEPHGPVILRGNFQVRARQADLLEAGQRGCDQGRPLLGAEIEGGSERPDGVRVRPPTGSSLELTHAVGRQPSALGPESRRRRFTDSDRQLRTRESELLPWCSAHGA